jgi:hypothetical protein
MANYIIEDKIDFFKNINTVSDDEDDDDKNICLITNEELVEYNIKLLCGHQFNYQPLFNEVYNQKHKCNNLEVAKLNKIQIKCPYCRTIQNKLLPYLPDIVSEKYDGVNSPQKYCMFLNTCNHVFKTGKKNGQKCNKCCNEEKCKQHINIKSTCTKLYTITGESPTLNDKCKSILKSGENKGNICNCKIFKDYMCKRHYNLANK